MSIRDSWNQVRQDISQLSKEELFNKYDTQIKGATLAVVGAGVAAAVYFSGFYDGGPNPYQEAKETLETINNTDNVHYQLDLLEESFWKVGDAFNYLREGGLSENIPKVNQMIEDSREAYDAVMANLENQDVVDFTRASIEEEAHELKEYADLIENNINNLHF